jgi:hypothetical protein
LLGTGTPDSNGHVNVAVPHGLPAGSHTILVAYGGDSTDAMSQGTAALTVAPGATAVSLSAPGSVLANAPLALSATVSAVAPGLGIPNGGTVMFLSDGVPLGSAAVSAAGTASLLVPNGLSGGEHSLSAVYQPPGVGPFAGGASAPIAVIDANGVSGPGPSATTLSIAPIFLSGPSRVPPWLGGRRTMVQIVAHVVSSAGAAASGSVALLVANRVVSIGLLDSAGEATFKVSGASVFNRPIEVGFLGGQAGTSLLLTSQSKPFTPTRRFFHRGLMPVSAPANRARNAGAERLQPR